jgi:uncharacterized membrane protein YkgB
VEADNVAFRVAIPELYSQKLKNPFFYFFQASMVVVKDLLSLGNIFNILCTF